MVERLRIAFATCPAQAEIVRRIAPRFAILADVRAYECPIDDDAADAVGPALVDASPHVVVAVQKIAGCLQERTRTVVLPFEFAPAVLSARLHEALEWGASIAVVPAVGTLTWDFGRIARRLAGRIHVLQWDSYEHLRDLIARCRRMGVETVVGSDTAVALAGGEGMHGLSLNDRVEEADGAVSRMISRVVMSRMPVLSSRDGDHIVLRLVLERILCGTLDPRDTVLRVGRDGFVTHVYSGSARAGEAPRSLRNVPVGIPLMDVFEMAASSGGASGAPLRLEVHPLPAGAGGGLLAILHTRSRRVGDSAADVADGREVEGR